jgi:hypothetical protein
MRSLYIGLERKGKAVSFTSAVCSSSVRYISTHAIETPGVLELVFSPCLCEDLCFLLAKVAGELL